MESIICLTKLYVVPLFPKYYKIMDESKFIFKLRGTFTKALKDYGLISDGDKVLIGLSGGKDSLAMVELFAERMKNIGCFDFKYSFSSRCLFFQFSIK